MAKEDTQAVTDESTHDGDATAQDADTNDAQAPQKQFTQADFDRAVSEASIKAEHNMIAKQELAQAQAEQKRLEEAGKHEELYQNANAELERLKAQNKENQFKLDAQKALRERGLAEHDSFIGNTNSIEEVVQRAERFKSDVSSAVEAEVRERLGTGVGHVPKQNTNTAEKTIEDMTPEEWRSYKKNGYSR